MSLIIKDRIKEVTTTTGTGAVSLGGATATFEAFSSYMTDGDTTYYAIVHTASGVDEWEVGVGTWNTGNTLTRTTVIAGTNDGSPVNFSAGSKDIFMTYPASIAAYTDGSGDLSADIGLGNHSTTELVEGSNLYYTDARVDAHLSGGTGVTYSSGAISIGQDVATTADVTFNTVTLAGDPTTALQAATKEYVDTIAAAGIHYHEPVRVESPVNLPATYSNGSSGVGATLTNSGTQAAITIDGVALSTADRVLVYNQTNPAHNGIYTVTTVGSGSTNWVLTRSTDADSYGASDPDGLGEGDAFFVKEGNTGAGELYVMNTSGAITFGTTPITFTVIAETAVYSAGTGLTLTGTTFAAEQDIATTASPTFNTVTADLVGDTSGTHTGAVVGNVTGNVTGNAGTATALATSRTIQLTGDVIGSATFNGTANAVITATVQDDSHAHVISNVDGLQSALDAKADDTTTITAGSGLTGGGNLGANRTISHADTSTQASLTALTGAAVVSDVDVDTYGHVTGLSTRNMTLADLGYTGETNATADQTITAGSGLTGGGTGNVTLNHADTSSQGSVNNSGATVIQDVTLDTYGHVTNLNSTALTPATIGAATSAQGALADSATQPGDNISTLTNDAGYTTNVGDITGVTAGSGITGGGTSGTVTINHADTSSQASVNNSGGTVIQDITLDTYGHLTGVNSVNLDGRYYTESEADSRFVNASGDTATGKITFTGGARIHSSSGSDTSRYLELNSSNELEFFNSDGTIGTLYLQYSGSNDELRGPAGGIIFHDNYHPNADKWTTARTLSLSGDVSGSTSWDGSGNASISVTVADDSHNHSSSSGNFTVGGDLIATDILPPTDNTGVVGNSSYTWSNGQFTNLQVNSTLNVRGAVDLADNDYLRLGSGDDFRMWHNGTDTYFRNYLHSAGSFYWQGEGTGGTNHNLLSMHNDSATPYVKLYYDSAVVLETVSGGVNIAGNTAWHAGNDGSGSGLDADLLDGQHGSYYYPASNPNGYTTYTANQALNTTSNPTFNDVYVADQILHSGDTNTYMQFHAGDQWRVVVGGSERLEVKNSSPHVLVSGDLNSTSDIRLKDDIKPIENALSDVCKLEGVSFNWKDTGTKATGFIAQQVEPILPDLVSTSEDDGIKSVNYIGLIGHLVEAIKEQQVQIDELKAKLNS
jgi:hypothetical protein